MEGQKKQRKAVSPDPPRVIPVVVTLVGENGTDRWHKAGRVSAKDYTELREFVGSSPSTRQQAAAKDPNSVLRLIYEYDRDDKSVWYERPFGTGTVFQPVDGAAFCNYLAYHIIWEATE